MVSWALVGWLLGSPDAFNMEGAVPFPMRFLSLCPPLPARLIKVFEFPPNPLFC